MTVELTIGNTAGWRLFEALFPEGTTGYLEVRAIRDGDVRQRRFVPLDDRNWGWRHVRGDAKFADIFFGVAPRTRQEGTKEAIAEVHAAWADLDSEDAATTLGLFDLPPSFVVSTGSEGHLHAFLAEPAAPAEIEAINRALAERLGADPVAVDASRMMRMPGTYNFKHDPPVKATLVEANEQRFSLAELEGALELDAAAEQHGEGPADPGPDPGTPVARVLERLEGVNPSGGGWQALCPAHDDQHPSLSVAEGDDGRCLLKCHAGCTTQAVIDALDLTWGDLFAGQTGTGAKAILDLVEATGAEPIRDPSGKTYIRIPVGDHVETWRTGSRAFKDWVRMLVLESAGRIAAAQSLKDAVDTLSAQAARGPNELDVHTRVAASDQNSYLDLCDKDWRTVEIRPGAWSVISASPVPFTRRGAMQALAEPVGGAPP